MILNNYFLIEVYFLYLLIIRFIICYVYVLLNFSICKKKISYYRTHIYDGVNFS